MKWACLALPNRPPLVFSMLTRLRPLAPFFFSTRALTHPSHPRCSSPFPLLPRPVFRFPPPSLRISPTLLLFPPHGPSLGELPCCAERRRGDTYRIASGHCPARRWPAGCPSSAGPALGGAAPGTRAPPACARRAPSLAPSPEWRSAQGGGLGKRLSPGCSLFSLLLASCRALNFFFFF
jgi:hypothetical protein